MSPPPKFDYNQNLIERIGDKNRQSFRCKFCQRTYAWKININRHLKNVNNHRSDFRFLGSNSVENRKEIIISDVVQHSNSHSAEKRTPTIEVGDMDEVDFTVEDEDDYDVDEKSNEEDTKFLDDLEFSDMEVIIKGTFYNVHKFVLSKSPVLKRFIADEAFEGFIDVFLNYCIQFLFEGGI